MILLYESEVNNPIPTQFELKSVPFTKDQDVANNQAPSGERSYNRQTYLEISIPNILIGSRISIDFTLMKIKS